MSRWLIAFALLVSVLVSAGTAGEEKKDRAPSVSPSVVARLILGHDGPQQSFAAQYLRQADHAMLLKVQAALRKLAPEIVAAARARGPDPSLALPESGPIDLVNVEVRILEVDRDSKLFRDLRVRVGGEEPDSHATVQWLEDAQIEVLLRAVEKSEHIRQITAPRLTVYDGQYANVSITNQIGYVRDVEVVEVGAAERVARPVMDLAQDGLAFGIRPTISEDRRTITIEMDVTGAVIEKPMRTHAVQCAGKTVEIQVPHIDLSVFRTTVRILDEGSFLLDNVMTVGEGEDAVVRLALVTARVTTLDAGILPRPNEKKPGGDRRKPEGK